MLNRDENGVIVSADKLSDITDALKDIEKKLNAALKKKDSLTQDETDNLVAQTSELKPLLDLVTPELQQTAKPMELLGFLKQVAGIKKLAEKIKENENSENG